MLILEILSCIILVVYVAIKIGSRLFSIGKSLEIFLNKQSYAYNMIGNFYIYHMIVELRWEGH